MALTKPGNERLTYMTAKEAAEYLRVSTSTLYRMEKRGDLIPLRTPSGHRRYDLSALNGCLRPASEYQIVETKKK